MLKVVQKLGLTSYSKGFIESYEIISETKKDGLYEIKVLAFVSRTMMISKLKSIGCITFSGENEVYNIKQDIERKKVLDNILKQLMIETVEKGFTFILTKESSILGSNLVKIPLKIEIAANNEIWDKFKQTIKKLSYFNESEKMYQFDFNGFYAPGYYLTTNYYDYYCFSSDERRRARMGRKIDYCRGGHDWISMPFEFIKTFDYLSNRFYLIIYFIDNNDKTIRSMCSKFTACECNRLIHNVEWDAINNKMVSKESPWPQNQERFSYDFNTNGNNSIITPYIWVKLNELEKINKIKVAIKFIKDDNEKEDKDGEFYNTK